MPRLLLTILLAGACGQPPSFARASSPAISNVGVSTPPGPVGARGRVAVRGSGSSYTEVKVEGTSERALGLCTNLVTREIDQLRRVRGLSAPIVTACGASALPPVTDQEPILLITAERATEADIEPSATLRGEQPARAFEGPGPTASVTRVLQFATLGPCEALRAKFEAEDEEWRAELKQAEADLLDDQIRIERAAGDKVCAEVPVVAARCARTKADRRGSCDAELEVKRGTCRDTVARIGVLEDTARRDLAPATRQHRCEPR